MIQVLPIETKQILELASLYEELTGIKSHIEMMKEKFENLKSNKDYLFLGANNEEGKLVGSLMGIVCYDLTEGCRPFMIVENVIVANGNQRQGIGKKLMDAMEQQAKARNCYRIMLFSSSWRKESHEFYETLGYSKSVVHGFVKNIS